MFRRLRGIFAYSAAIKNRKDLKEAPTMNVKALQERLREFAEARDWNRYHSPKNLASALAVEAAELLENFQWLTEDESRRLAERPADLQAVREEIADVQIYLLRLADLLDVDLEPAVLEKMTKNGEKYPVEFAKGHALKYNRFTR
jgi:NTP pyrophosphatase (non-canonical NTP hydrolase)